MNEVPNMLLRPKQNHFQESMETVGAGLWWVAMISLSIIILPVFLILLTFVVPVPLVYLWGMWKCFRCPVVPYGGVLIFASGFFYLAGFACLWLYFSTWSGAGGSSHEWIFPYFLVCFVISSVIWQIFLLCLARGLESWWLAGIVLGLLAVCLLGGCVMIMASKGALNGYERVIFWMVVTYVVAHPVVLFGLKLRIEQVVQENE